MQNLEIVSIVNAYTAQREAKSELKLPAAIAWKRRVNMDKLIRAKGLIDDAMKELGERYSDDEHSEEGENGTRKVKPEFLAEYLKEQADILSQDTDVDIRKAKVEELGDIEISDADMDTLAFMIEDGD